MGTAKSFTKLVFVCHEGKPGFDAYVAVWDHRLAGEIVIGAPTMDALANVWATLTNGVLDRTTAQHVILTRMDGPEALFAEAKAIAARAAKRTDDTAENVEGSR